MAQGVPSGWTPRAHRAVDADEPGRDAARIEDVREFVNAEPLGDAAEVERNGRVLAPSASRHVDLEQRVERGLRRCFSFS